MTARSLSWQGLARQRKVTGARKRVGRITLLELSPMAAQATYGRRSGTSPIAPVRADETRTLSTE